MCCACHSFKRIEIIRLHYIFEIYIYPCNLRKMILEKNNRVSHPAGIPEYRNDILEKLIGHFVITLKMEREREIIYNIKLYSMNDIKMILFDIILMTF